MDVKATETISAFVMAGYKSSDDIVYDDAAGNPTVFAGTTPNFYGPWGGDWAIWGGLTAKVTPQAAINVELSYDDFDNFAAVANVAYELVPGFKITPEVTYQDNFDDDNGDDNEEWGGQIRFQRDF